MKNIVVKYGFISGGAMALFIFLTYALFKGPWLFEYGYFVGYTGMLLAFSMIYVGVRSYRDGVGQGSISFGKALQIGLLIMLISSACYVVAWLIVYYNFFPDFIDRYAEHAVEKLKRTGAGESAIQAMNEQMGKFKEYYKSPFYIAAFTLLEPLPVGILVSLITAFILKKKS